MRCPFKDSMGTRQQILIMVGVVVSVFTTVFFSLGTAFTVYAVQLKETFHYSQTDVGMIASSILAGAGASIVEAAVLAKCGYKGGYFFIWIFTSGPAVLMWLTVVHKEVFSHYPIAICGIHFLMSIGQNAGSVRVSAIAACNFSPQHTGKLVGIYFAAIGSAKLFYGLIFETLFDLDLRNFFLALSILYAFSVPACFCLHRPQSELTLPEANYEAIDVERSEGMPVSKMLADRFFHLTFWPSALVYNIQNIFMNNLTSIAHSLTSHNPLNFVYTLSSILLFGRVLLGLIYDKFQSDICGQLIILGASLCTCCAITLFVVSRTVATLYAGTVLLGFSLSCGASIPSSLLAFRFGQENLRVIIGFMYCFIATGSLVFQFVVGVLYDRSLSADGSCYGPRCFFMSSIILLILVIFGLAVHSLNFYLTVCAWLTSSDK